MKKKMLVTASTFPRWDGDTEPKFVFDLSKAMSDYYDVTVLAPMGIGAKEEEIMNGIKIKRFHYFPIHSLETLCYPGSIIGRIKKKKVRILLVPFLLLAEFVNVYKMSPKYDVVHAHWVVPQGIMQSFSKCKYIVTGHGSDIASLNKGLMKCLKRRCFRRAAAVVVVSRELQNKVTSICEDADVSVIPMGVWKEEFGREHRIDNYFNQNGKKVILFVGRLAKIKGIDYLIDAMKWIDGKLVIVGDGEEKASLLKKAEVYKEKIEFLGAKTHDELKRIYASADVFVAPSIEMENGQKEGFGLVCLEAIASGIPVVVSRDAGFSEIIRDGVDGMIMNPKDPEMIAKKVNSLLLDEKIYNDVVAESRTILCKYDYREIAKNYIDLLRQA